MLYKIRDQVPVTEDNPEILAIPEFAKLTDRQLRFVCLVADRRSPLRTLPERDRREKVARLCGWPMEGNRLDKNGREVCAGRVESIERAIERYKEYQYDDNVENLDAINKQIQEIRDYLQSDKEEYLISNGKIVLDKEGNEVKTLDPKTLKLASDLGEKLPGLIEAKLKLESILQIKTEETPEITTYTSADLPDEYFEGGGQEVPAIEAYHMSKQKQSE